jgi:hypothetical protein
VPAHVTNWINSIAYVVCCVARLYVQQVCGSSGAGSSRQALAAAQDAWAPWKCAPAQGLGESAVLCINPRNASVQGRLRLQLGQPITLHFVAVDYMGCPAVLNRQQRQKLASSGLQLQPAAGRTVPVLPCQGSALCVCVQGASKQWCMLTRAQGVSSEAVPFAPTCHLHSAFL